MSDNKKRIYFYLGALIIFSVYAFFRESNKEKYLSNFENRIIGVLQTDVSGSGAGNELLINGDVFYLQAMHIVSGNFINFSHIAMEGDSIRKMASSDTLILIKKNGKKYVFTFGYY